MKYYHLSNSDNEFVFNILKTLQKTYRNMGNLHERKGNLGSKKQKKCMISGGKIVDTSY